MTDKLSSSMTSFYKLTFPILWIGGFGLGTIAVLTGFFDNASPTDRNEQLTFLLSWIIGSSVIIWFARRLKDVSLKDGYLVIQNYRKIGNIPISNITHLSETRFVHPKQIILRVYPECEFGEKVVFIPKFRFYNPFREHPTITMLRQQNKLS